MTASTESGPGASEIGRSAIKVRELSFWQPKFSLFGPVEPCTYLFQLVVDREAL